MSRMELHVSRHVLTLVENMREMSAHQNIVSIRYAGVPNWPNYLPSRTACYWSAPQTFRAHRIQMTCAFPVPIKPDDALSRTLKFKVRA